MQHNCFALFGNHYQTKKTSSIRTLVDALQKRGAEILIDKPFYDYLRLQLGIQVPESQLITDNNFQADIVVSMGGDGTFLEVASRVQDKGMPILGINMGRLGFLADVTTEEICNAIEDIYNGKYLIEHHSLLEVKYNQGKPCTYPYALNEVAVLKRDNSSMISISVDINGQYLTTYQADGLIVNTPTGSTGYALSVGGPTVLPQCNVFGITAVAPHSLNVRPIILPDNVEIHLSVCSRNHQFLVAIDGRSEACEQGLELTIRRAPYNTQVLKRMNSTPFNTLRKKLMWGTDLRNEE